MKILETCQGPGCVELVDERKADEHGRVFCGASCRDARDELTATKRHHALLVDGRYDVGRKAATA